MRNYRLWWLPVVGVTATLAAACDEESTPVATLAPPRLADHVGCPAAKKFTGGGRIDPGPSTMTGKVTFGFNVHADANCGDLKGQMQVVHHPTQTKFHTVDIDRFASWTEADGGECGEISGTIRAKHNNEAWHEHEFESQFCDYGEPGSTNGGGRDTFRFEIHSDATSGHGSTSTMRLTGGNIQAH